MDMKESFAAEIRANPYDDMARLVYADYLEENGDPQGELIRIQCELAGTPVSGRTASVLQDREAELLERYGEMWLEPLRELGAEGIDVRCFRRGLVERVRIRAARLPEVAERLCDVEPALHCLELRGADAAIDELVATTMPPQIVELELASNRLEANHVRGLEAAPWRDGISVLNLGFNRLADDGVAALAELAWDGLRRLTLDANRIGPDGARAIANWPSAGNLDVLRMNLNVVGLGTRFLAESMYLEMLRRLELASNQIPTDGAEAIAIGTWFGTIEELILRNNPLGPDGLRALARTPRDFRLVQLDVRNTTTRQHGERDSIPPEVRQRFGDALVADQPAAGAGT